MIIFELDGVLADEYDKRVEAVHSVFSDLAGCDLDICIWTSRCESVEKETREWLYRNIFTFWLCPFDGENIPLKMRPVGDTTPAHQLKQRWLDEYMAYPKLDEMIEGVEYKRNDLPQMVFEADPETISMFRRRGVFVFDCNQRKQ